MKITGAGICTALATATALGLPASSHGAGVLVDWLSLVPGGPSSSFSLAADGGLPAAHGSLLIESGKGVSFPGFPISRAFNSEFWSMPPGFADSVSGDQRVAGFDLRVAPQSGMVSYTLTLDVPAGRELILAVGGLFRSSGGATQSVATTASGGGAITFLQALAWDGGSSAFDQELEWTSATGTLSTTVGSDGDSEIAFLRVAPLSGSNPQVMFSVPNGYSIGTGDSISFAIGTVVPEPTLVSLLGIGLGAFLTRRRR